MTLTPDFKNYLRSLSSTYEDWWNLYTLFDFGLTVQTWQPKQTKGVPSPEKHERLPVLEGIRRYAANHVLLMGRPGSGKSTALVRLLLEEVKQASESGNPNLSASQKARLTPSRIPVLVELKYYQTSILDLIQEVFKRHDLLLSVEQIAKLLRDRHLLLMLDALNELPSESSNSDLATFRKVYAGTPMIFTTRDTSLGSNLGIEKCLEMQPLTEAQMRDFVQAYLPNCGEQLLQRLKNRLREFAQTPLLLWILCSLFQQAGEVPPRLGWVLRQFTQGYERNLAVKNLDLNAPEVRPWWTPMLQHLAFAMMQASQTEFRAAISQHEGETILTKFLQGRCYSPPETAHRCLKDLLAHHLIQAGRGNQIEFRHQLLQEYYAAELLLAQLPNLSPKQLQTQYLNYLKWTEPLSLMLSLVDKETIALEIVQSALQVDLKLGAKLAGEVHPSFQQQGVQQIVQLDLPQLLKIELLGSTRSEYVVPELLKALETMDAGVRRCAASAL
ncbi:MAG: NTPase (NACHT family), partial [Leptolyngbyaceae cyanobacterium CSU_1_4]|nr:NTPase (NACHT family) [Leptolyngbyaceae cyanobacterium CSU_1_4]